MEAHPDSAVANPSVSLLIETANLAEAELAALTECLRSLGRQTYPIETANDVLVLDASDEPSPALQAVCAQFPWVELRSVAPGTNYGDLKALSGAHGSGEVIVLCDSDCRYEPDWLEHLLRPFAERPDVQIVSGETTTPIDGPYGLAIGLTFVFPRFSGESRLTPSRWYWANNVAVRRAAFEQLPLPSGLPIYRGQNVVHAKLLHEHGQTIWREPRARAMHELPRVADVVARYVAFGDDTVTVSRLVGDRAGRTNRRGSEPDARPIGRAGHLLQRARSVFSEEPQRLVLLPLALPVVTLCLVSYVLGMARAYVRLGTRRGKAAVAAAGS